ncbi:GNAT family N-acetyltransferase [Bacillus mycoides]|uniref:GNAT family N-acetyltransferase n=1 Tax=Bacillus thuringiensis serovar navarrensis TaxID=339658 RepID=A0A243A9R3_BACTU|nr:MULTISPECIES: GNAT family N-acetyltransferase [Bacillus]MBJ7957324.1 GNAT family N-acetyltransferase [Bacillus cereus group sp. N28]MDI6533953.1 GNAT family N-acetyltransferase [Bacillus mycoides]MED1059840.1 GNAT family N-acetyltransferase [Bacillus mycoides]MED1269893.1 GNAT family N-acetyltransferase [Bacillus mycoides]OTY13712.1 GNAT family N-acetyltransferase [Bacillus thuringiensis serovar navarrensis]
MRSIVIEEIKRLDEDLEELSELLKTVVNDEASIGFLPPLEQKEATNYWQTVLAPEVILYVAKINNEVAGSIQLHLVTKPNGIHRAEICKLMTHPNYRRNGIGRLLMQKAEERAKQENRSLLVLDTREGDSSNRLYKSLGFQESGKIPGYAISPNGELDATVIYYKMI